MTPSVRLSMDAHATLSQSLAAIWLPLWKEQSGQAWNTLCYKRQVIDVMALWWFCLVLGWQGGRTRRVVAPGAREQEQHCGMRGWTAGHYGQSSAWGHWLGTLAGGHWPGPRAGGTAGPHQGRGSARAPRALKLTFLLDPHLTALAWSSAVLYFWLWDAMLKQLELQPKQLMIEKEENGNTLKNMAMWFLQLCHRIPPQLFRLAERIIQ